MPTPATVYISESNGAGEVVTDNISNINFGSVDQPNIVAANHPVIISESSFFKMLRVKVQSLGTSTKIKDLRVWKSAGAYVTGETLTYQGQAAGNNYVQPSDVPLQNPPFNGPVAIPTADPGVPRIAIGGSTANEFPTNVAVPGYSNYSIYQIGSTGSTPVGPANTKTILFQYDET